jgi:hypothetical protein
LLAEALVTDWYHIKKSAFCQNQKLYYLPKLKLLLWSVFVPTDRSDGVAVGVLG